MLRIIVFLTPILFFASLQNCILRSDEDIKLEKFNQRYEDGVKESSKRLGLTNLEDSDLSRNDIEIRFYRFSSGYIVFEHNGFLINQSVLILRKTNGKWNAKVILDTFQTKDGLKVNKLIAEIPKLSDSDLESYYQKLLDKKIISLIPNQKELVFPDAPIYAIETKIKNKYDFTFSYTANEVSEEKDSKQIAELFNIVATEFELGHFQAPKHLLE